MAEHHIQKNYSFIKKLPDWAKTFAIKYCSNTAGTYIFHGNIRDFLSQRTAEDTFKFVEIQDYIGDVLFGYKGRIVCYDRSSGISFVENPYLKEKNANKNDYIATMNDALGGKNDKRNIFTRNLIQAFSLMEQYFYKKIESNERVVFIIDFAETIIPISNTQNYSDEDRFSLVTIKRWAYNPIFIHKDITVILLTENLFEVNQTLIRCPSIIKISVPIPDESTRLDFVNYKIGSGKMLLDNSLTALTVAKITGGLNLVNINQIAAESYQEKKSITLEFLRRKKKELIENESAGLLEFIESESNLDMVSGHEYVKQTLKKAASNIKQGSFDVLPMGYLISGPIGTGKTFLVSSFTGEIGIPVVRMLNFRSKYVGATEGNIEKILNILKAMAPVAVMIDEADAVLGDRNQDGDSGTSNRVFAQIASFMGNTEYRGKIIWFLITCRPDLIPVDIKRQGRCEEHFSLFYPTTPEERNDLFFVMLKKLKIKTTVQYNDDYFKKHKYSFSGADIEAILVRSKFIAASEGKDVVEETHIMEALNNFIPAVYPHEVELQNLVSVLECTHKSMIPEKYRTIPKDKIVEQVRQIKMIIGER